MSFCRCRTIIESVRRKKKFFFYMAYRIRIVSDTFRFVLLFFMLFDLVKVKVKIINQIIYFIFMCQLL